MTTTRKLQWVFWVLLAAFLAWDFNVSAPVNLRDEPPLKILLMSATLEGERLAALLGDAPVVRSSGRMHPVAIHWGRPFQPGEWVEPKVVQTVLQALSDEPGSLLVFLSADMPHEVLPATRDRLSLTGWFRRRGDGPL